MRDRLCEITLGAQSPTWFCHWWGERNPLDHDTDSEPASRLPYLLVRSWVAQTSRFLRLWCDGVGDQTWALCTPSESSNLYATRAVPMCRLTNGAFCKQLIGKEEWLKLILSWDAWLGHPNLLVGRELSAKTLERTIYRMVRAVSKKL